MNKKYTKTQRLRFDTAVIHSDEMQEEEGRESRDLPNRAPAVWDQWEHRAPLCQGVKGERSVQAMAAAHRRPLIRSASS